MNLIQTKWIWFLLRDITTLYSQYCKFTILTIKFTVRQQQYFSSLKVMRFDTATYLNTIPIIRVFTPEYGDPRSPILLSILKLWSTHIVLHSLVVIHFHIVIHSQILWSILSMWKWIKTRECITMWVDHNWNAGWPRFTAFGFKYPNYMNSIKVCKLLD